MDRLWHRLSVYWGLREDAELQERWQAGGPDVRTRLVGFALGVVVVVAPATVVVLIARAVFGGDTSLGSVLWGGVKLIGLIWLVATLGAAAVRWARRLGGRRAR